MNRFDYTLFDFFFYQKDPYNNWEKLGEILIENKDILNPTDRTYLLHNIFANAFADRSSYSQLSKIIKYLSNETNYLAWKTVHVHLDYMLSVLQYKKSFYQVSVSINMIKIIGFYKNYNINND